MRMKNNMCQLTLIDLHKDICDNFIPQMISVTNVFENNIDGFGFHLFDSDEVVKTNTNALDWWLDSKNVVNSVNGIYHVRRTSYKGVEPKQFHAHPFRFNDIVLVHNGTLAGIKTINDYSDVIGKHAKEDFIDSQMFTRVLADKVGKGKLTLGKLNDTLHYFTGPFAFLIRDLLSKNKVFIVRDSKKTLFSASIKLNDKPVGLVINTLDDALFLLTVYLKRKFPKIEVTINQVPKLSVNEYKIGSYILNEPIGVPVIGVSPIVTQVNTYIPARKNFNVVSNSDVYEEFVNTVFRLGFQISEVLVICEYLFKKSLFTITEKELDTFYDILIAMDETHNFKGRHSIWNNIKDIYPGKSTLGLYTLLGIKFPFILNTRAELLHMENTAKKAKGLENEIHTVH